MVPMIMDQATTASKFCRQTKSLGRNIFGIDIFQSMYSYLYMIYNWHAHTFKQKLCILHEFEN